MKVRKAATELKKGLNIVYLYYYVKSIGIAVFHTHSSLQCRRILAGERILIKRAPSWIQTRKRLGEGRQSTMAANLLDRSTFVNTSKPPALQAILRWGST